MSSSFSSERRTALSHRGAWLRLVTVLAGGALVLTGCNMSGMDWDLRPSDRFSTSQAAQQATAARPQPDARGVISYPGYQVVVARRGETVSGIAQRLEIEPAALARHNAIEPGATMRGGELLVLPGRVEASDSITATPLAPPVAEGPQPLQHSVRRGETAFSIARLYNVSPRSLAEWNGLGAEMNVREGQILVIPVAESAGVGAPLTATGISPADPDPVSETPGTTLPGQGSPTPVPPSATAPLPDSNPAPAGQGGGVDGQPQEPVANLGAERTQESQLAMPVQGRIIRAYARGSNDGIGIGAPAGATVSAAASGTVAAITRDTDQVPILVIRHEDNLLTVYANIGEISVSRGDRVARGQSIATVRQGDPSFLHFEVREGFESVDPMPYLQ